MTEEDPDDDIGQTAASALFCYQGGWYAFYTASDKRL